MNKISLFEQHQMFKAALKLVKPDDIVSATMIAERMAIMAGDGYQPGDFYQFAELGLGFTYGFHPEDGDLDERPKGKNVFPIDDHPKH